MTLGSALGTQAGYRKARQDRPHPVARHPFPGPADRDALWVAAPRVRIGWRRPATRVRDSGTIVELADREDAHRDREQSTFQPRSGRFSSRPYMCSPAAFGLDPLAWQRRD